MKNQTYQMANFCHHFKRQYMNKHWKKALFNLLLIDFVLSVSNCIPLPGQFRFNKKISMLLSSQFVLLQSDFANLHIFIFTLQKGIFIRKGYYIYMKRDYYSDIKLTERIIFQNTAYLLTMLDKKLDSFTSLKIPYQRIKERTELLDPDTMIDPQKPKFNPLASLADDLTKPIWNCITRVQPVAVSLIAETGKNQGLKMVAAFNYAMNRFFERFKYEHQDESSLKLHINLLDISSHLNSLLQQFREQKMGKIQEILQKLFETLIRINQDKSRQMNPEKTLENERIELLAEMQILEKLTIKDIKNSTYMHTELVAEVCHFVQNLQGYIKNVAESFSGPVYINYYLKADTLPLVLHPVMLAIYSFIKSQIAEQQKHSKQPDSSQSYNYFETPLIKQPLLQDLKPYNCTKITFINLDGYESKMNLSLAKHLGKFLQYISFPEQQLSLVQDDSNLKSYFKWRSEMLAKQYLASAVDQQTQKNHFGKSQSQILEFYKRLIVIPVKSIYISQKSGKLPSISGYQSHFVSLIMKEIIYNQIRQFGPSVIIISHANTLPILPNHLEQLLSQLSILTNMKIIFYNNIAHNLLPHIQSTQENDAFSSFHKEYFKRKQQSMFSSPSNLSPNFTLSVDMLERAAIFLKICSGTSNLNFQVRQIDQRYQNSRIMRYAGNLMRMICRKHPSLSKYDNRFIEYLKIDKLSSNCHQPIQPVPISSYHKQILNAVQNELQKLYGLDWISSEHWKAFSYEYKLNLHKERKNQEAKYFTKYSHIDKNNQKPSSHGLLALEFQIVQKQSQKCKFITLSPRSQILISEALKYPKNHIFVLNHLNNIKSYMLSNYFGTVESTILTSCQARVELKEFHFNQNLYELSEYQHFTQFNYYQTEITVIFFWPLLFDAKEALLHTFRRTNYQPKITPLLFVGNKSNLTILFNVVPQNQSHKDLIPRIGCTCYSPPQSNFIYVFGGFYTDRQNYLNFQTDISVIQLGPSITIDTIGIPTLTIDNIPKSFFMELQSQSELSKNIVTSIYNDFVRPRVQYEVYELPSQEQDLQQILLLGGIGEKFTRPFSLVGYMAHLIRFQFDVISKIDRIKLNNIVPANLSRPIKARVSALIPVIKAAQNTKIHTKSANIHPGTLTFSHFNLKYISQDTFTDKVCTGRHMALNRRMIYQKCYEVGLNEKGGYLKYKKQKSNTIAVFDGNQFKTVKWNLRHFSCKQKNQANVLLTLEGKINRLLVFVINLEEDVGSYFPNLKEKVLKLAPHHIIAADTYFTNVFVLFCHPELTKGLTILARSYIKRIEDIIDSDISLLNLNKIYYFDKRPQKHIIKVMQQQQVALLHGLHFSTNIYEEYLVKRVGSYYTRIKIERSNQVDQIIESITASRHFKRPNNKSFFIAADRKITCLSFVTVARSQNIKEKMLVVTEELLLDEQNLRWTVQSFRFIQFQLQSLKKIKNLSSMHPQHVVKQILDIYRESSQEFYIVLCCQNYVFDCSIRIESLVNTSMLVFKHVELENKEGCQLMTVFLYKNYENQRLRHQYIYSQSIDKFIHQTQVLTQIISQHQDS